MTPPAIISGTDLNHIAHASLIRPFFILIYHDWPS